ncbi:DUF802 domain-containing protein [Noviherbaspirillum aridicola]|uniref:DUF802 domain-containing protein n=1 Tax=Noviherbaspirillum aridicola TaxID=2849687 RepID=A0ABQ4PZH9_9BURK|nr:DUF802 domain-containing protein [Noviherbaspirillum aridicola]GIZ50259.1 hypothetical protein NCCP691_02730 [Noviherbaspirillum aridicola]
MNRHLFGAAFALGALAIAWVAAAFIDSSLLALSVTFAVAVVYCAGALELRRYREATASLNQALAEIPADMTDPGDWLGRLHPSLQNAVRLRIEGERVALPGPALTPYLVGLLVMLGMLGTFLGMVVTLNGAVFALEKTADLEAIRSALAVPVMGLGLAFGTSIAGVAASAMLGLMSALSRRDRTMAAQLLDTRVATSLRRFSLAHQRQESFRALQRQSEALPRVVDRLEAMMAQMEGMSQQLNQRLLGNQEAFHADVREVYTGLAHAVDESLRESLGQAARAAGESIRPVVEAAMSGMAQEARLTQARAAETVQRELEGLSARFDETAGRVTHSWAAAVKNQEQANAALAGELRQGLQAFNETFEQRSLALVAGLDERHAALQAGQAEREERDRQAWTQTLQATAAGLVRELQQSNAQTLAQQQSICESVTRTVRDITEHARASAGTSLQETARLIAAAEELMRSRIAAEADWMAQHRERMDQLAALLRAELGALRDEEAGRGHAAVERLGQLQAALASHLTTLGTALEAPIARLIETASEAPRAAADVIGQLRREISISVARDNELLEERSRIMETLNALLDAINHASVEQRAAIDSLVASSAKALDASAAAFSDNLAAEATKLSDIAAHVAGSAVEVSSLSEALGVAVQSFGEANEKLIENLQRIEGAMDKSMARSDEQLAYYVAQAREIIDLSMSSHKEIVEQLRQLPARRAALADEVR